MHNTENFKQFKSKKLENSIYISKTIAIKMQTILAELHLNLLIKNKFLTSNSCFYQIKIISKICKSAIRASLVNNFFFTCLNVHGPGWKYFTGKSNYSCQEIKCMDISIKANSAASFHANTTTSFSY